MRRRRHEVRLRQNGYWLGLLDMAHFHGINPTLALDYFDYVDALDVEVVQQAARRYFNRDNYVRVVLLPENYIE
jgi:zinc protease